jgi:hypothetical protein
MNLRNVIGIAAILAIAAVLSPTSARAASKKKKRLTRPGTNTTYSWTRLGINKCREAKKPILLYVYDDKLKASKNNTALHYENNVFPNKNVVSALSGYTCVMRRMSSPRGWPRALFAQAHRGAAVYLMACDGRPLGRWVGRNRPDRKRFVLVARQIKQANPAVAERMAKNPPKKYEDPPEPKVAQQQPGGQEPEEKKPKTAGLIPGLGGEEEDKDKKGTKKPPPRKPRVEEEEEEE